MKFTTRIIPIPPIAALDAESDALSLSKGAEVLKNIKALLA